MRRNRFGDIPLSAAILYFIVSVVLVLSVITYPLAIVWVLFLGPRLLFGAKKKARIPASAPLDIPEAKDSTYTTDDGRIWEVTSAVTLPVGTLRPMQGFVVDRATFYLNLITDALSGDTKRLAIQEMVGLFTRAGVVQDGAAFFDSVLKRESLGSTGLKNGVALLHAKTALATDDHVVIGVAISKKGIPFDAVDGKPTKIFFVIASGPTEDEIAMKTLAHLYRFLKIPQNCAALTAARSSEEIFQFLKQNLSGTIKGAP